MQTQSNSSMRNNGDIDIPDLTGTLAVVTGANSGLGLGITRRVAAAGAEVILAVRNAEKGKQAIGDLLAEFVNQLAADFLHEIAGVDRAVIRALRDQTERHRLGGVGVGLGGHISRAPLAGSPGTPTH